MKLRSPLINKSLGLAASLGIRAWMHTLDMRAAYYDPTSDPADPGQPRRGLYLFWHENILMPLVLRQHCRIAMLMSRHRDADILSRLAFHFGFDFVRGSTSKGGDRAMRELIRKSRDWNLTITPDGPRGPRRRMSAGPIYLASRLRMPIVLLGMGYDRPWRAPSWDRFAVPRPYSRARCVMSPRIELPRRLDRDGIEHYRLQMETLLTRLSDEAEAWATSESHVPHDVEATPGPSDVLRRPFLTQSAPMAVPPTCPSSAAGPAARRVA